MFPVTYLLTLFALLFLTRASTFTSNNTYLTATALVTDNSNNSALECWEFTAPFNVSSTSGTAGSLSFNFENLANATYTILPPRFDGGLHNAPVPHLFLGAGSPAKIEVKDANHRQQISAQILVFFISGLAYITLPTSNSSAYIIGGGNGLIIATDTVGTGHFTSYPTDEQTVALTVPFGNGKVPAYRVLGEWACVGDSGVGQVVVD
ncbi:MAG: hypothetical protein M1827_003107 [Pycnora praestabilis]|nr:MAG: hypothetical protein M1827_003107 [Pycnora praestabilis]